MLLDSNIGNICNLPQYLKAHCSLFRPLKVDLLIYTPALRASLIPEAAWHVRLGGHSYKPSLDKQHANINRTD